MRHDATVRNAADPEQVQYGARKEKRVMDTREAQVRAEMDSYAGRRFVWAELERAQVFHHVTLWSWQAVYEFLGRREHGLTLWWELQDCCPEQYDRMVQEARQRSSRDQRETEAVHTVRASDAV